MIKDLDPLRVPEPEQQRDEPPPTVQLNGARERGQPEPIAPLAPPASMRNTPSSRVPAVNTNSASYNRRHFGTHYQVSIRENITPQEHIRLYGGLGPILVLFALGFIVAILLISILKSGGSGGINPGYVVPGETTSTIDPNLLYPESDSFVEPLFGQYAVKRCSERCELRSGQAKDACVRGCNQFQIAIYGRRISFDRYDGNVDVTEITNRCTKRDVGIEPHALGSGWYQDLSASLTLLEESGDVLKTQDFPKVRAQYHKLLDANARVRTPPGGTAMEISLTKDLLKATCLQANAALTALALATVQQAGDETSARYYRQIAQGLEPKVNEYNARVLSNAKSLKLR